MKHDVGIRQETHNPTHRGCFYAYCTCGWHSLFHRPKPDNGGPRAMQARCWSLAGAHQDFWETHAQLAFVGACRQDAS